MVNLDVLTEQTKAVARWLVEQNRAGNLPEEFHIIWYGGGYHISGLSRSDDDVPFVTEGAVDSLIVAGLLRGYQNQPATMNCTMLGTLFNAVDSSFASSAASFIRYRPSDEVNEMSLDIQTWKVLQTVVELQHERREQIGPEADDDNYIIPGEEDSAVAQKMSIGLQDARDRINPLMESGYLVATKLRVSIVNIQPTPAGRRLVKEQAVRVAAEEIRDQILRIMHSHEKTGAYDSLLQDISTESGLELDLIQYHVEILEDDGYVSTESSSFGAGSAKLTASGKRRVVEGYLRERSAARATLHRNVSINIQDSTVGFLNTGEIEEVDSISVNISHLIDSGHTEFAEALTALTKAVAESQEIASEQRSFLLENLEELSTQAVLDTDRRAKPGVLRALITGIAMTIGTTGALAEIWSTWGPMITKFFGV